MTSDVAVEVPRGSGLSRTTTLVRWALAAIAVGSAGMLLVALPINLQAGTDASLVELAGLASAAAVLRWALLIPGLLQLALVAQLADMVTFAFAWQRGAAEQNPLARVIVDWALAAFPGAGSFAFAVAGVALIVAKLVLVFLIVRIAPYLGRYRSGVLVVALMVGLIGALSNLVALSPA